MQLCSLLTIISDVCFSRCRFPSFLSRRALNGALLGSAAASRDGLTPSPRRSFTHPPMFPSWEPFVFLLSAAMIWDNVRGHWSRQGSIGVSILPLLALRSLFFFFFLLRRCDEATGADGVWLHTLFLTPFSVCECEKEQFICMSCLWLGALSPFTYFVLCCSWMMTKGMKSTPKLL